MIYCTECARKESLYTTPQRIIYENCELCGKYGPCNVDLLEMQETKTQKLEKMKQKNVEKILDVADELIFVTGSTTVEQVLKGLEYRYPKKDFKVKEVRKTLDAYAESDEDVVKSGDSYVQATMKPTVEKKERKKKKKEAKAPDVKKVSRTEIATILENTKGRFFTIVFKKKENGEIRVMNGQVKKANLRTPLGNFNINEIVGRSRQLRQVDPKTIQSLTFNGIHYNVK